MHWIEIVLYAVAIIGIAANLADKFIFPLLNRRAAKKAESEEPVCEKCGGSMTYQNGKSFWLPGYADAEHEAGSQYYVQNAIPGEIEDLSSGRRGGMLFIGECLVCKEKVVQVQEYLQVRGEAYLHSGEEYPYAELQEWIESGMQNTSSQSPVHMCAVKGPSMWQ